MNIIDYMKNIERNVRCDFQYSYEYCDVFNIMGVKIIRNNNIPTKYENKNIALITHSRFLWWNHLMDKGDLKDNKLLDIFITFFGEEIIEHYQSNAEHNI